MNDRMIIKGDCGPEYMTLLLYCANDGNDNRKCCDLSLVTLNNPQCEEFCSDDPNRIGPIKSEHQDCIIQMPTIMKCHWFGLNPTSGPVTLATVATLFPPLTLAPASTIPPLITKAVLPTGSKQLIEQTKSPQNDIGEIQWTKDTDDIKWKKSTLG